MTPFHPDSSEFDLDCKAVVSHVVDSVLYTTLAAYTSGNIIANGIYNIIVIAVTTHHSYIWAKLPCLTFSSEVCSLSSLQDIISIGFGRFTITDARFTRSIDTKGSVCYLLQ